MTKAREERERVKMIKERGCQQIRSPYMDKKRTIKRPSSASRNKFSAQKSATNECFDTKALSMFTPGSPTGKFFCIYLLAASPIKVANLDDEPQPEGEQPLLFIDVNLGEGVDSRIIVFEGNTPRSLAKQFSDQHNLDQETEFKLRELLQNQISNLITKIDEESEDAVNQST